MTNGKEESSETNTKSFSKQDISSKLEPPFGEPRVEVREIRNEEFDREHQEE